MKIKIAHTMVLMVWVSVVLGMALADYLEVRYRVGFPLIATGFLFTMGRSWMPRPPLRSHVPNDAFIEKLSDLLLFGVPAGFCFLVGLSAVFGLMPGFALTLFFSLVFLAVVLSRPNSPAR
ncbi:MAG: hypothetical protein AAF623_01540 [Planctomycetota bacterium]